MNLIELSEQLKDVPDQLLMKEVQAPSGAYPSYLVVTEMSRRKRMRDQAQKEAPTTTVAQDLAQPSREQMMAAMAATQQRMGQQTLPPSQLVSGQGPQGPQAQMMSQPAPRLNAGIMAAPQAANALSAQDVMAAEEPRRMAGGGMVAFAEGGDIKYDDRGVPRFQSGAFLFPEGSWLGQLQRGTFFRDAVPGSLLGQFQESYANDPAILREQEERRRREENAAELRRIQNRAASEQAAFARAQSASAAAQSEPPPAQNAPAAAPGTRGPSTNTQSNVGFRLPDVSKLGPAPGALTLTPVTIPLEAESKDLSTRFAAMREPTADEVAAARQRGAERYAKEMPFRYGFLEKDIAKREKDIEGRRGSNINEALIQTGLGIMGSKSPRFLQAAGEAGTAGLNAYRQGLKDIRDGERDILQSKTAFANAQTLYDQGKFAAAEKEKEDGEKKYDRGITRLTTENAILTRNQSTLLQAQQLRQQGEVAQHTAGLNAYKTQMEGLKLPYELNVLRSQAGYYDRGPAAAYGRGPDTTPSPAEIAAVKKLAFDSVNADIFSKKSTLKPMSPEFNAEVERRMQQIFRDTVGKNYTPISPAAPGTSGPPVRNSQQAPLGGQ
jgi:hypothetical protein